MKIVAEANLGCTDDTVQCRGGLKYSNRISGFCCYTLATSPGKPINEENLRSMTLWGSGMHHSTKNLSVDSAHDTRERTHCSSAQRKQVLRRVSEGKYITLNHAKYNVVIEVRGTRRKR